ncbi:MAG: hypothetical protein CSA79_05810 [Thiothrix nivea]|nr:MAG: hypothetical protein CSA79_05810 [Thiothrix nivea]
MMSEQIKVIRIVSCDLAAKANEVNHKVTLPKMPQHAYCRSCARVEHVFRAMKAMGGQTLRSIGLARATFGLSIQASVYNLRRLCSLKQGGITPF